jgi:hypothetical protein
MSTIAGFPYFEIQFTREGSINDPQAAQHAVKEIANSGLTDLIVISHGWNNDMSHARKLYEDFFSSARKVIDTGKAPGLRDRKIAVLGVLWPSKKFADRDLIPSGAASAGDGMTDKAVHDQLDRLQETLGEGSAATAIREAGELLADLEFDPAAKDAFVEKIRSALPRPGDDEELAGEFFSRSGTEIFDILEAPSDLPTALSLGDFAEGAEVVDAAGLGNFFSGVKAAALRVANYATYYLMKERAGTVGRNGVRQVIEQIQNTAPGLRIHLVGHSFGARVVTSAAAAVAGGSLASMSLLQAAFSHNGFAQKFDGKRDGFFRNVITGKKIRGPLIITHTANDHAVGVAYPIASRLAGQDAAALGEEDDRFGALGRNGALTRFTPEAVAGELLAAGSAYRFSDGKICNLEASSFIGDHNDVTGRAVASAVLSAVSAA